MLAHVQGLDIQCGYNSGHDDLLQQGCDQLEADTGGRLCTGLHVQYPDPPPMLKKTHLLWDPVLLIRRVKAEACSSSSGRQQGGLGEFKANVSQGEQGKKQTSTSSEERLALYCEYPCCPSADPHMSESQ
jgi:hypothetical protein